MHTTNKQLTILDNKAIKNAEKAKKNNANKIKVQFNDMKKSILFLTKEDFEICKSIGIIDVVGLSNIFKVNYVEYKSRIREGRIKIK